MGNLKKHKLNSEVLKIKVNKLEIKSRIKDKQNTGHKESIDISPFTLSGVGQRA